MITVQNLTLAYSGEPLFDNVTMQFIPGNCYGIIGANGAGKSTFLKVLSKELETTKGQVILEKGKRLSFLKQDHFAYDAYTAMETVLMGNQILYAIMQEKDALYAKTDFTEADGLRAGHLEEEFAAMDGWNAESEVAILLNGLGIETAYHETLMSELEANVKVKILLAQALFGNPDVLLLDEPTNHLDLQAINWLEEFLINLESTVLVVSHDRHFLNKICTHIVDIDYGKIQMSAGNYDFWYQSSQLLQKQLKDSNRKKEEKMKELQDFIDRFSANASKSKQATSRKQALSKIQLDEIIPSKRRYPFVDFKPESDLGNSVLSVDNLCAESDQGILSHLSFVTRKTDKILVTGSSELQISYLFDCIYGDAAIQSGTIEWGITVSKGYFTKNIEELFANDYTLIRWLSQFTRETDESIIRGYLGRMLFSQDEAFKKAKVLSGGEKVRCVLSKLMIEKPNFLIMDDPTNHLDMESIQALNNAMIKFNGCLLFSTHDHEIAATVATRVIELQSDGSLINYDCGYEEYLLKRQNKSDSI